MRATEAATGFVDLSFVKIGFEEAHPVLLPGYRLHMDQLVEMVDSMHEVLATNKKQSALRLKMSI
jgi:hypothetical protein